MESNAILIAIVVLLVIIIVSVTTRSAGPLLLAVLGVGGAWALLAKDQGLQPVVGGGAPRPPFKLEDFEWAKATGFSSPQGDQILQEICFFRRLAPDVRQVVDATAHVGVDTAVLAHSYPQAKITAIERDPDVFRLLETNLERHGYADRVTTLNESAADFFLKQDGAPEADLVYFDPPWGGPGYEKESELYLLGKRKDIPVSKVINKVLADSDAIVVLKTPHNFDYRSFEQKLKGHVTGITRIKYRKAGFRQKRALYNLLEIRKTACREE